MTNEYLYMQMIQAFEEALAADTNDTREKRLKAGEFHYIPLGLERFTEQLDIARLTLIGLRGLVQNRAFKFIDAGCGVGSKVLAAQLMSSFQRGPLEAYGIEKDPRYVKAARRVLDRYKGRIVAGDAIKHDYSPYDIVYFYRPLCNPVLELKLESRITSTIKSGSIVIGNGCSLEDFRNEKKFRSITNDIFLKL